MRYLLLCLALCACAETTAPALPDFSRGCIYADTVLVDGPVNGVVPPPPYPIMFVRAVINDSDDCIAAYADFPGKVHPR